MSDIKTSLEELKLIYDHVAESIVLVGDDTYIVLANESARKQFILEDEEAIPLTKITEFLPLDIQNQIFETMENDDTTYFEVMLKKSNCELFEAFVSAQPIVVDGTKYAILTIVDLSVLKEKEKEQLKKLKSHIITQATTNAQKQNELKVEGDTEIKNMQEKYEQLKHEMFMLERKLTLFERENKILNTQCDKIQEDSFSFEQVLDREIALAKRYGRHFSLAIVAIDDFKGLMEKLEKPSKQELVIKAFKKHFRSTIRTTDVVYYENSGLFYFILPNTADMNITDLVDRLLHAKKIDTKIIVRFNCGMAHFYEHDTKDHILYRVRKNLEKNIEQKNVVESK